MVEYLNINDKKYPVRIGYYVMKQVKAKHNKTLNEALAGLDEKGKEEEALEVHEDILYAALQMGAYAETGSMSNLDLNEEDMPLILDLCFFEYFELFQSDTFFPKDLQEKVTKNQNDEQSEGTGGEESEGNDGKKKRKRTKKT